jgi:hypothetical protein
MKSRSLIMTAIIMAGRLTPQSARMAFCCGAVAAIASAASFAASPAQEAPKSPPQDPSATASDRRPGETLSEQLDRNKGVIRPPAGVDPGIAAPVPDPTPGTTPVIPPPGTPGGNPAIQPK